MPPKSKLACELSCCWQDAPGQGPRAKPVQRNVLGRKLSCCWQDRAAGASDPGLVAAAGYFRRRLDCSPVAGASNRDCGPPFTGAILTNLPVFRIGGNLLAAIIGAAPSLAFWSTADGPTGLKLRGLEDLLTIATTPFDHTGVVSLNWIGGRV